MSTITTIITHGITLSTSGAYTSPLSITSSGGVTNASGTAIFGDNSTAWTIDNSGTVLGGGSDGYGVRLLHGTLVNGASNVATAEISAPFGIVTVDGLISNYATISGSAEGIRGYGSDIVTNHAGGLIVGQNAVRQFGGASTVNNLGTMLGTASSAVVADGDGDVVINGTSGATLGLISASASGVLLQTDGSETVVNYGTISGTYGIDISAISSTIHATIIDAGTIIGSSGVAIGVGPGNYVDLTLRFVPGNAFIQGTVVGEYYGTGILEFTSGSTTGTLTGAGADFTNFPTASVDAGASWVLAGSNTLGSGVSLVDAGTLTNTGSLVVDPPIYVSGTLSNSDTIVAVGSYNAVSLLATGTLLNTATGLITSYGDAVIGGGTAAMVSNLGTIEGGSITGLYGIDLLAGGTIINGAINNTTAPIDGCGGIYVTNGLVSNYGSIAGHAGYGIVAGPAAQITNQASGTIVGIGGLALRGDAATLANLGTVYGVFNGVIVTGNSDTIINGTNGGTAGLIGSTLYYGIALSAGTAASSQTVINYGTISGVVGIGANGNSSYALYETIIDAGTIIGTSGTAVSQYSGGGTVNLLLQFIPGNAYISGTVFAPSYGNSLLEFATGASTGTLTGYGADFTGFSAATIDGGASWVLAGNNTIGSRTPIYNYGTLANVGALINLAPIFNSGVLINSGEMKGGSAIYLKDASLTNTAGGHIYTYGIYGVRAPGADTIVNQGTMVSDAGVEVIYLNAPGTVSNAAGALIYGYANGVILTGSNDTLINLGSISAVTGHGVYLGARGGLIQNGTAGSTGAVIQGYYGVEFDHRGTTAATGTLLNYGTIVGYGGTHANAVRLFNPAIVVNGASNATSAVILGTGYGINTYDDATVTNYGTVLANTTLASTFGIYIEGNGSLSNLGTAALITGDIGVTINGGGTIIDSGTIVGSSGPAIGFGGTASHLLVLERGYVLQGGVLGSASGSNTVELLGTSAADTITANYLGLQLGNIGTIAFATGAANYATLNIEANATVPGAIAGFVQTHDTIDLQALDDSGNNAHLGFNGTSNVLTVFGSSGSVDLQLGSGDYSSVAFVVTNDGSNGTEVHPQAALALLISGTEADQPTSDLAAIQPFTSAAISDPNGSLAEAVTITLSAGDTNGTLSGSGLSESSPGVYNFTESDAAAATTELQSLVFTPTPHQVAPGDTIVTGFTLTVTDALDKGTTDGNTSVIATADASLATIAGATANQGVPNQTPLAPFAAVSIDDPNFGATDTVVATMSGAGGTFSNPGSGIVRNGTYSVTGAPGDVSTALDALVFTPTAPATGQVATTNFTIADTNAAGTTTDSTTTVTTVEQVLGLATVPAAQLNITVTPVGIGSFDPQTGLTNESVIRAPVSGGRYVVPAGYQAAYLGGLANAELTDTDTGHALLVGNPGNDTLAATIAGDTILGGSGTNLIFGGNAALLLSNGTGDTIGALAGGASVQASGSSALIFGDFATSAGSLSVSVGGASATISAGNSSAALTTGGSNALVYGGFGALAGGLDLLDTGRGDTVSIGDSGASLTLQGANALVFGDFSGTPGSLNVVDAGSGDTISAGNSAATIAGGASPLLVFGGAGTLNVIGGNGAATIVGSTGAATVAGGAGGSTLYGSAGGAFTFTGSTAALYVATGGNESLNASGSSGGNELVAGADSTAGNMIIGGSGSDTLYAGAGADTLGGSGGSNLFAFFASLTHGNADVISDFNAGDTMYLSGYGANDAATALANATSSAGSTTIILADNTRITFLGIGNASLLQGHVFSF